MRDRKIIAIDFDGTIVKHKFPYIGEPIKGAKDALETLKEKGYYIIISSARNSIKRHKTKENIEKYLKDMKDYLDKNNISYDEIDGGNTGKVFASFYIDEKGISFNNDWNKVLEEIDKKEKER